MLPPQQAVDITRIEEMVDVTRVSPWDPLWAILVLAAGVLVGWVVRNLLRRGLSRSELPPNVVDLFGTVAMWSIVGFATLIALSLVGFVVAPVVVGIALIVIVFVVTGRMILENFGAGITLQTRAPFQPGDEIDTQDILGKVIEVNSRVVVIDTIDQRRIYVPNAAVLSGPIVNLTEHEYRMSTIDVELIYGTDLDRARETLLLAIESCSSVAVEPAPEVQVTSFRASGIGFAARFWHAPDILAERTSIDEVARAIDRAVKSHDLHVAFPQRTLWWGAPETTTLDA